MRLTVILLTLNLVIASLVGGALIVWGFTRTASCLLVAIVALYFALLSVLEER